MYMMREKKRDGQKRGSSYVRIRQAAVVVHDFRAQNIPKRRKAEFKNVFASALKLVGVIQTLVKLNLFCGPERPFQRQEHVGILRDKENVSTDAAAAARRLHADRKCGGVLHRSHSFDVACSHNDSAWKK